jgi:hypothetical protein
MSNTIDFESPAPEPWTPSRVLVAMGPHRGAVLEYQGSGISNEIAEGGLYDLDELGLDDAPAGLSVWEGDYIWEDGWFEGYRSPENGEAHPHGKFRPLTPKEWAALSAGEPLWPSLVEETASPG